MLAYHGIIGMFLLLVLTSSFPVTRASSRPVSRWAPSRRTSRTRMPLSVVPLCRFTKPEVRFHFFSSAVLGIPFSDKVTDMGV